VGLIAAKVLAAVTGSHVEQIIARSRNEHGRPRKVVEAKLTGFLSQDNIGYKRHSGNAAKRARGGKWN
jgi:hypothetical protein